MSTRAEEHNADCWLVHDACALDRAADALDIRIGHATSQRALIRGAQWRRNDATHSDVVALARMVLTEIRAKKWKPLEVNP